MEVRHALFLPRIRRDFDKLLGMTLVFIHKLLFTVEERIQMDIIRIDLYFMKTQKKIIDKKDVKNNGNTTVWKIATVVTLERQHCSRKQVENSFDFRGG